LSPTLRCSVHILDHQPPLACAQQVWRGGETDRATRGMRPLPLRWLALTDEPPAEPAAHRDTEKPLLSWDLEQVVPGNLPAPERAGGVVLVSMDCSPEVSEEFNEWYNTEHIPLLSAVPGMIAARRFRAHRGSPGYVALYHVKDIGIYASPTWMAANETPWIRRLRRYQHNRTYFMFQDRVA
jgi:hypothetical protein